jgi:D-glycero-D-manno-heptose 1,7-bisphosphate phosphatase
MAEGENLRPAIFIDRDGTLIEDEDYLADPAMMRVFDFSAEALQILKEKGYLLIIITNQSGVGKGLLSENDVRAVHEALRREIRDRIDAFYFCPHHPDASCQCRKPELGMVEQALEDFPIDLANSWFVGDKKIDVETGFNAGMGTALVLTGYGAAHLKDLDRMPDIVADNFLEAAREIALRTG